MNTKLTLTIDPKVIDAAKEYARGKGKSLSSLVENYLKLVSDQSDTERPAALSPKVRRLMGSVKLPDDFDYKTELGSALTDKYGK